MESESKTNLEAGGDPVPLTIVRLPGPHGPTLYCRGDLTVLTQETLRRQVSLLVEGGYDGVILHLDGIRRLDPAGIAAIRSAALSLAPSSLLMVAGTETTASALRTALPESLPSILVSEREAQFALAAGCAALSRS